MRIYQIKLGQKVRARIPEVVLPLQLLDISIVCFKQLTLEISPQCLTNQPLPCLTVDIVLQRPTKSIGLDQVLIHFLLLKAHELRPGDRPSVGREEIGYFAFDFVAGIACFELVVFKGTDEFRFLMVRGKH